MNSEFKLRMPRNLPVTPFWGGGRSPVSEPSGCSLALGREGSEVHSRQMEFGVK